MKQDFMKIKFERERSIRIL